VTTAPAVPTTPAPGATISVQNLSKRFGAVQAVQGVSFDVMPGRVTGFLGPNGAGKTTTLRMLLGLVYPTSGSATVLGRRYVELAHPARQVGAVLEATSFHPSRRARSHLKMLAIASGIDTGRIDAVLDLVGLSGEGRRKVRGFSLGMRQRLELAGALLGDPQVLILDEPANGLDPQGMAWLRQFIRHLAGEGRTVLVSSHLLAEMAQTVDDVVIISQGVTQAQGPLADVMSRAATRAMQVQTPEVARLMHVTAAAGLAPVQTGADWVRVDHATPEFLGPLIAQHQVVVYQLTPVAANLEQVFFSLTTSLTMGPEGAPGPVPPWGPPPAPGGPGGPPGVSP
jgi:ABC-2 type transport system ATP-binding protein